MKQMIVLAVGFVMVLSFLLTGCSQKPETVQFYEDFITVMEDYINDCNAVDNAEEAAAAIHKYVDGLERIYPTMHRLIEKNPGMKASYTTDLEFSEIQNKATETSSKMADAMMKIIPYMDDPKVKKAFDRMRETAKKNQIK